MQSNNRRKLIKVSEEQAKDFHTKFLQFNASFNKEKNQFNSSPETKYYLVSTQYLKQWIQFCQSHSQEREEPDIMNQDLLDAGGQLRPGLVENQDFEIVSENIFKIVLVNPGVVIDRKAIVVNGEKKVPIYLSTVKYMKLRYKDLQSFEYHGIEVKQLVMKATQIYLQDTIASLITQIKQNENVPNKCHLRLWKNDKAMTFQAIVKYLKDKQKSYHSSSKCTGIGKLIENNDTVIENLDLGDGDYFIAQVSDDYDRFYFKADGDEKCQSCYKYTKLPFPCGCKAVAYCTEQCLQKDRKFHIRDCNYAEQQELNEVIDMRITNESSLGRVGLSNLGNTCFMNSCLQCLSNCIPLTEYFIQKFYEKEINKDNPLGSKGRLAKNYAKFIKNMWCQSERTYSPHNLKGAVAKINPIFSGYAQHDSQQFFSFLVDGIHQDLNRIVKKPYVQSVDSKGRPDEIVALESWLAYTQRNQSIIVDLMTGQYKSKVICPECNLESITFDPFTTISLPIPEEATIRTLKYFVMFSNNKKDTVQMNFQFTKADSQDWLQSATKLLKKQTSDFAFYLLTMQQNIYSFKTTSLKQIIHKFESESKLIFLLELTEEEKSLKESVQIVTRFAKPSYFDKQYEHLWFKRPFFFQKNSTTVLDIYKRILAFIEAIKATKQKNTQEYYARMLDERPFKLVLKYKKSISRNYLRTETSFDSQYVLDDDNLKLSQILEKVSLQDCQLDVRFTKETAKLFNFQKLKSYTDETQVFSKKNNYKSQATVSLDQCFNIFEQKQSLEQGNQWYCPRCKDHKLATKQMTVYKAPQILILHLKRFKNKGILRKQKNETNVTFPMILDMKPYLINPSPMSTYNQQLRKLGKYIQPSYPNQKVDENLPPEYELFAISNHFGGLGGGHYTAYGKNRGQWFEFNDSSVRSASEGSIKGSGAYMLFYKRKNVERME